MRVIVDGAENKAGQAVPGPRALEEELFQKIQLLIDFFLQPEEKLLNSAVQLAQRRRTRRRPQQTVAL